MYFQFHLKVEMKYERKVEQFSTLHGLSQRGLTWLMPGVFSVKHSTGSDKLYFLQFMSTECSTYTLSFVSDGLTSTTSVCYIHQNVFVNFWLSTTRYWLCYFGNEDFNNVLGKSVIRVFSLWGRCGNHSKMEQVWWIQSDFCTFL